MPYQSEFLKAMEERGFLHQGTDMEALDRRMSGEKIAAYIGFDCTAPSLHVGSLIQIMALRWLQKTGHKPIVLLGGGTTKIGDPSGKDEARKILSPDEIRANADSIRALLEQFLDFGGGPTGAVLVNNAEWLDSLNYLDFLRDYGRHFSVNRMMTFDSVRLRLDREQNLSFLEFNYMILQAYDFVELNRRHNCLLQMGGSDQWGNIVSGVDLYRRMQAEKQFKPVELGGLMPGKLALKVLEIQPMIQSKKTSEQAYSSENFLKQLNETGGKELFGVTTPLLATASGAKMGKTASGAVWLSKDMLSAYDYWQFWRNTEDADVGRFLRLFTELPMKEIAKLEKAEGAAINEVKKTLASEATRLAHGDRAARQAAETARKTFEEGAVGEALPEVPLQASKIGKGVPAYELFRLTGLSDSGSEAKRLIRGGGARINDRKLTDEMEMVLPSHFEEKGYLKLTAGRKRHAVVKLTA